MTKKYMHGIRKIWSLAPLHLSSRSQVQHQNIEPQYRYYDYLLYVLHRFLQFQAKIWALQSSTVMNSWLQMAPVSNTAEERSYTAKNFFIILSIMLSWFRIKYLCSYISPLYSFFSHYRKYDFFLPEGLNFEINCLRWPSNNNVNVHLVMEE